MEGGGKMAYSYGGHHHQDTKLLKSFSRVEPRKFGLGLVAGFLLVTCAYFSTAKFDAIHIAIISSPSKNAAAGIGSPLNAADGSKQQLDLGAQDALSKEGSKAEVLEKDDDKISSLGSDLGHNASLGDKKKDETFARDGDASRVASAAPTNPAVEGGKDGVLVKGDDASGGRAVLPPLSSDESTNSTQELGVLEDEELQVQDAAAAANPPKKSSNNSNNGSSPAVVPSDPAVLPAPVQQIPPTQEHNAPPVQQIPFIPEVKQTVFSIPTQGPMFLLFWTTLLFLPCVSISLFRLHHS